MTFADNEHNLSIMYRNDLQFKIHSDNERAKKKIDNINNIK